MLGEALVLAASLCWAIGANLYKGSMKNVNPICLNLIRSSSATVLLMFSTIALGGLKYFSLLDLSSTTYLVVASVIGWAVGDTLYFMSLKWIGVSRAVPIAYAYPLFMFPMSIIFLNEPLTTNIALGTITIILAVWLISKSAQEDSHIMLNKARIGIVASIVAALCWAIAVVMLKRVTAIFDPIFIAFFKMLAITPFLTCYVALSREGLSQIRVIGKRDLAMALMGGAIAVGFGDMIYFIGLSLTQANIASPLGASTPIFAAIIAIIFFREKPSLKTILGTLLTMIGVALLMS